MSVVSVQVNLGSVAVGTLQFTSEKPKTSNSKLQKLWIYRGHKTLRAFRKSLGRKIANRVILNVMDQFINKDEPCGYFDVAGQVYSFEVQEQQTLLFNPRKAV